ncbi:MAG: helix-turn-helix domain-containing protein [Gammaproteobacteria bacterium]
MFKNRKANNISCLKCFVSSICLARNISTDELIEIDNFISNIIELKKDEHAYFSGDPMADIYSVYQGSAKQFILNEEGVEQIENFYLPGDLISLESIPNGVHLYSLRALEDTKLCIIPISDLTKQMQVSTAFTQRVLNIYSYKMQNDKNTPNTKSARQRVIDILLNIFYRLNERRLDNATMTLPMSQLDISYFLGMSHETVNRILRQLHNEKYILLNKKKIYINDVEHFKSLGSFVHTRGQN